MNQAANVVQRTRKFLNTDPLWPLWLLLLVYVVLVGGAVLGVQWQLKPGVAFARLLEYQWISGSEAVLASAMLVLARFGKAHQWLMRAVAAVAAAVSIYHLLNYFIGTEFMLLWGAAALARERGRVSGYSGTSQH